MTDSTGAVGPEDRESEGPTGPVIRDKRRLDPETGQVREAPAAADARSEAVEAEVLAEGDDAFAGDVGEALPGEGGASADHPDTQLAADRLEDLRRLQAEYVNYKRRVDRDRVRDREAGTTVVVEALLPVLDDLHMAKEHGELTEGPLLAIADKLESTLGRFGVERLGAVGEVFDPALHEALMHLPEADLPEGATETTIVQVMQPGFKVGDRVVRAARVAVANVAGPRGDRGGVRAAPAAHRPTRPVSGPSRPTYCSRTMMDNEWHCGTDETATKLRVGPTKPL